MQLLDGKALSKKIEIDVTGEVQADSAGIGIITPPNTLSVSPSQYSSSSISSSALPFFSTTLALLSAWELLL